MLSTILTVVMVGTISLHLGCKRAAQHSRPSNVGLVEGQDFGVAPAAPADRNAAHPGPKAVKVFFEGGFSAQGLAGGITPDDWVISADDVRMPLHAGAPPYIEFHQSSSSAPPRHLRVSLPGWQSVDVMLPKAADSGSYFIEAPVALRRDMDSLSLGADPRDTDYDTAELVWLRPLKGQKSATPSPTPLIIPLHAAEGRRFPQIPTGVYDLVLRGDSPTHVRAFVLAHELTLSGDSVLERDRARHPQFALPRTVMAAYVGFADSWVESGSQGKVTGAFLGLKIDWKIKGGSLMVVNVPMSNSQAYRYTDLKPTPDGVWPIINPQLLDPVTLEFDSPMSFADHHFLLKAADGIVTLKAEFSLPEGEPFKNDMYARMKAVFKDQGRNLLKDPAAFDPSYSKIPAHELPGFSIIANQQSFADHLTRMSRTKIATIELGELVTVKLKDASLWDVRVEPFR